MQLWEGFEIVKNAQYVDVYERNLLRTLGYFILQVNSKKRIRIEQYVPLPWDKKYLSVDEARYVDEFNPEVLENYDRKMKELKERGEKMKKVIENTEFESWDLKTLYGRNKFKKE